MLSMTPAIRANALGLEKRTGDITRSNGHNITCTEMTFSYSIPIIYLYLFKEHQQRRGALTINIYIATECINYIHAKEAEFT